MSTAPAEGNATSKNQDAGGDTATGATGRGEKWRMMLAGAGMVLLLAVAVGVWYWPKPLIFGEARGWRWWLRWPETNVEFRAPAVAEAVLHSIQFVDASTGWAVGESGTVLKSEDGGETWCAQKSTTTVSLKSVRFVDRRRGWVVGGAGTILATTDGGVTWAGKPVPVQGEGGLSAVYFADETKGWAVGEGGAIMATVDGGATWIPQKSGVNGELTSVYFANALKGVVVGQGLTILVTEDGGATWSRAKVETGGRGAQKAAVVRPFSRAPGKPELDPSVKLTGVPDQYPPSLKSNLPNVQQFPSLQVPQTVDRRETATLHSVVLLDDKIGYAVGGWGAMFVTHDGGASWLPQESGVSEALRAVHFSSAKSGWASGPDGVILVTRDGGRNWERRKSGASALGAVSFVDATNGWAVDDLGSIVATSDGGATWRAAKAAGSVALSSMYFTDARRGWGVGKDGVMLSTADGGEQWTVRKTGTPAWLTSVVFVDGKNGWAVGGPHGILATRDGGFTWAVQKSPVDDFLSAVFFMDTSRGWAVGQGGAIVATEDGGANWREQDSGSEALLNAVAFVDAKRGWAVGTEGTILSTEDGGATWRSQRAGEKEALTSVAFMDAKNGLAAGGAGTSLTTDDGGVTWRAQKSGVVKSLRSLSRVDTKKGWAVGDEPGLFSGAGEGGTLFATEDGGVTWKEKKTPLPPQLTAVHFVDGRRGWVVGKAGTIFATDDGGETWKRQTPYRAWPPPLLWLGGALGLVALFAAAVAPSKPPTRETMADIFVSDAPLNDPAKAPAWMRRLSEGLANYLANPKTGAPVTLAITGAWGQGKSSVMELLRGDLKNNGHRPVWFNAWHHQDTNNVLAAMLGAIREQAIPPLVSFPTRRPFVSFHGVAYYVRLAWRRLQRRWLMVLGLSGLLAFSLTWFAFNREALLNLDFTSAGDDWVEKLLSVLAACASVAPLAKLVRMLRSFGVDPSKLLVPSSGSSKSGDLEESNVFLTRFAVEFDEVTRALGAYQRMVIFIDDLDRCASDHLLKVLEATNYLNSSGQCFIVLGMQRESVLAGLREELGPGQLGPDGNPERWLEKLVQIDVGVPPHTHELEEIFGAEAFDGRSIRKVKLWQIWVLGLLGAVAGVGLVWAGVWAGINQLKIVNQDGVKTPPAGVAVAIEVPAEVVAGVPGMTGKAWRLTGRYEEGKELSLAVAPAEASKAEAAGSGVVAVKPPFAPLPAISAILEKTGPRPGDMTEDVSPANASSLNRFGTMVAGICGVLLMYLFERKNRDRVEDSERYKAAKRAWDEVLKRKCRTPREMNRVWNRMRFDAMLVRALGRKQNDATGADAKAGGATADAAANLEAEIVTLAAMEKCGESLAGGKGEEAFDLEELRRELVAEFVSQRMDRDEAEKLNALMGDAIAAYQSSSLTAFRVFKTTIQLGAARKPVQEKPETTSAENEHTA